MCLLCIPDLFAHCYQVSNKAGIEEAVRLALPGDSIVLMDKVWSGVDIILTCNGSEDQPIAICPENPGGASLEHGSRLVIAGDYLVVSGFLIRNGNHADNAIRFASGSDYAYHSRLTECVIHDWGPSDPSTKVHWVVVSGGYNRIDHCRFTNMHHRGVTLVVKAGADQVGHHRIDHNYFGNKPEGAGNGYESIKMGGGDYSMYALNSVVAENVFYRCDGEVELISNKSWSNSYRHNTFIECMGTITLRFGRECLVEGNYFLGNERKETGGIRITDQDHLIINNYMEGLQGKDARAAISMMSGIPDIEGGNSGHAQSKNVRVLHNTIIHCKESLNIGYYDKDDLGDPRGELTAPENCTIANNILWSSHAPLIREDWESSINTSWATNIAFGAELGVVPDSGMRIEDPLLAASEAGIYNITLESPALNAASLMQDTIRFDFETQARQDGSPDIGADEWSTDPGKGYPLGPEDVGPSWQLPTHAPESHLALKILQIYPNPTRGPFRLHLPQELMGSDLRVEIMDVSGRKIWTATFPQVSENPQIALDHVPGLYLLHIQYKNQLFQSKIIIK